MAGVESIIVPSMSNRNPEKEARCGDRWEESRREAILGVQCYMRLQTVQKIRPKRRGSKRASQRRRLMETNRREPFPMARPARFLMALFFTFPFSRFSARSASSALGCCFSCSAGDTQESAPRGKFANEIACCVGVTSTVTLRDFLLWLSFGFRRIQVTCPTLLLHGYVLGNDREKHRE